MAANVNMATNLYTVTLPGPKLGGISVWVVVDDHINHEYGTHHLALDDLELSDILCEYDIRSDILPQTAPHMVSYIQSKPEKPFKFLVTLHPSFTVHGKRSDHVAFRPTIDGRFACALIHLSPKEIGSAWYYGNQYRYELSTVVYTDNVGFQIQFPFRFAAQPQPANVGLPGASDAHPHIAARQSGTLKVEFFHMREAQPGQQNDNFGDPLCRPFAVFEFRYRTRDDLAALNRDGAITVSDCNNDGNGSNNNAGVNNDNNANGNNNWINLDDMFPNFMDHGFGDAVNHHQNADGHLVMETKAEDRDEVQDKHRNTTAKSGLPDMGPVLEGVVATT
ncbi:hypothetical protein QBC40DRAFT_319749 [Triangularia verruculosa]|uniref:DUF7918 domain-containing protein n=1 Tax=Triangularia verruculosa TaxID=2587418 RepID=A0AAN6XLS3_9PEZI|nr:hypothetical protein QBC40DRAFT_319749 [Triangularia verruculosa]